jgi:hypothetical protein
MNSKHWSFQDLIIHFPKKKLIEFKSYINCANDKWEAKLNPSKSFH